MPLSLPEFDALYARRHEAEVLSCVTSKLQSSLEAGGEEEYEWQWRVARLAHFQAMQAMAEKQNPLVKEQLQKGAQWGERAEKREPTRVEGVFWRAVCDLEGARLSGSLAAARALGPAQKRLEAAAGRDEGYHFAGPVRVLGRIFHFKPLVLGGSLDRAIAFYDRALQLAPTCSTTLLYRAEAFIADRQPAKARQDLNTILQMDETPDWVWETRRDQALARDLMAKHLS